MSTIDIVARLQLRAEQFSSETGARFAEMKSRAQSAATGIRQEFNGAFAEVQKLAGNALTMPRTQSGSLDLSGEIAQLRAAAAASDQQAVSLRELSMAQMAAAGSGRADAEALRLEADAAAVGSLAAERAAASTRDRIGALQAVQAELNRSTSATTIHTEAGAKYVASAGAQRQSTMMMGQQLQDFIVQTSNGTAVTTAFSQQIGQMAFALQGMGGRAAAVGAFLGSMAGTGVMVLLTMTPLIAKLIEGNNALDDAVDKLAKDAEQSDVTRKAKEQFGKSIEGVTAALKDQEEALKKVAEAENTAAEQANIAAKRERDRAVDVRKTTVALLEQAIAQAEVYKVQSQAPGQRGELATLGLSEATNRVAGLQDQLAAAQAAVAQAERVVQGTRVDLAAETAKRMADPMAAINHMYDEQAKAARKAARDTAAANGQVTVSLTAQLTQIEKNREAAKKTEQERQAAERRNERAGPLTSFLSPVSGRVTGTFGEPRPGHTHGGIDYAVPVGTPVRAPAAGTIDVAGARGALGNAIYINFGGGTTGRFGHLSKFNVKPGDTVDAGDIIGYTGGARGEPGSGRSTGAHLHYEVRRNGKAVDPRTGRFPTDAGQAADDATKREQQALDAAKKLADFGDNAARSIAGINAQWDEQPRLIDRARLQAADLDAIIKDLRERQPPGFEKMIADAQKAKVVIVDGIDRPFREFIKSQKEGLAVGTLVLQGRDAEAEALQNALRIQQQQGPLDAAHLAAILEEAEQHQRISEALEDQRRLVGVYTGAVNNLQREFDDFLDAFEKRPGKAIGGIISGVLSTYKTAAKDLLSNAIFGGVDRDIEKYVRKMTGQQTPAEILADQAVDAGKELRGYVDTTGSALDEFVRVVRGASGALGSPSGMAPVGGLLSGDTLSDVMRDALGESSTLPIAANDNPEGEITVIGQRLDRNAQKMADAALKASDVFGVGIRGITGNLAKNFGIVVPDSIVKGLEKHLPSVLQGAALGQLGGSVFSAITGGKKGSSVGGAIGGVVGKEVGTMLGKEVGGMLGKFAGPLGAIAGGVLGNLVGGLFAKTKKGSSTLMFGADGLYAGAAVGNSSSAKAAAAGSANSVLGAINRISEALDGDISGAGSVSIGKRKDKFVVDTTGRGRTKGAGTQSFASEEEAVRAAITDALRDGVIGGISDASKRILAAGGDLEKAITKAGLIESVPRDLKAIVDPIGAAVDDLNRKFQKTKDALVEGGATAEQMAQAQQLYNLQLAQVKAGTASASQELKDFLTSLKVGSNSPYSLRDQEASASAALKPFLDQIAGGQSIDQAKYQSAAQAFLEVERELYGSTQQYFDALEAVQAATNNAIAKIDNAVPIGGAVPAPFAQETAASAAATAAAVQTGNQMTEDTNALLARMVAAVEALSGGSAGSSFIGASRGFVAAA